MHEFSKEERERAELEQIRQISSPFQAKHIGKVIRQIVAKTGLGQTQSAMQLEQAWRAVAGPEMAAVTQTGNISRGVLYILAQDHSALQEFNLRKKEILDAMQRALPHAKIRAIRARLQ